MDASVTYQITATSTPYGRTWVSASKAAAGTVVTVRLTPNYDYEVDGLLVEAKDGRVVLPVYGVGLWGPIWGYVALQKDMNTIAGVVISHSGETPGLGAEIATPKHWAQYVGKTIFVGDLKFENLKFVTPATTAVCAVRVTRASRGAAAQA